MEPQSNDRLLHWNYFLALEADLGRVSRFVEFDSDNYDVYSIEIARLLQTACSEVDVLAQQLCRFLDSNSRAENMDQYRSPLKAGFPELEGAAVQIPRYGLTFTPWTDWHLDHNPEWWSSHNKVKHHRNEQFKLANLKNLLNAASALLLLTILFYRKMSSRRLLEPPPSLFKPASDFAQITGVCGGGIALFLEPE